MLIGSFVVLVLFAAVLVAVWPNIAGTKSIWLKDGGKSALKLGNVKAEMGVSYLASAAPVVNYIITRHGEFAAEGKYQAVGMSGTFDIFPRDREQDRFPYLLTGEIVGNRVKITMRKKIRPG